MGYLRIDLDRKGLALFCLNNLPKGLLEAYLDEALGAYDNYVGREKIMSFLSYTFNLTYS